MHGFSTTLEIIPNIRVKVGQTGEGGQKVMGGGSVYVNTARWWNNAPQREVTAAGHVKSQLLQVTGAAAIQMRGSHSCSAPHPRQRHQ